MPKSCHFCGGRANSQEHIISRAIVRDAFDDMEGAMVNVRTRGRGRPHHDGYLAESIERVYETATLAHTVGVCRNCNNGWMNDVDSACRDPLVRMIRNERVLLDRETRLALARWAFKTSISFDAANAPTGPPAVPREHVDAFVQEQRLPVATSVNLFSYRGPRVWSHRGFPTVIHVGSPTAPETPAYQSTILLGALIAQVWGVVGRPAPLAYLPASAPFRLPIYPDETIGALLWPPHARITEPMFMPLISLASHFDPDAIPLPPSTQRQGSA